MWCAVLQRSTASSDLNGTISHPVMWHCSGNLSISTSLSGTHHLQLLLSYPVLQSTGLPHTSTHTHTCQNRFDSRSLRSWASSPACTRESWQACPAITSPPTCPGRSLGCDCAMERLSQHLGEPSPGQASRKGVGWFHSCWLDPHQPLQNTHLNLPGSLKEGRDLKSALTPQ